MKVLVAEDDPIIRRLLEATLTRSGYEVVTAENGARALDILRREGPPTLWPASAVILRAGSRRRFWPARGIRRR